VDVPGAIGANVNATGAPGGGFQPPNVLQQIVKDMLSVRSAEDGEYGVPPAVLAKIVAAVRQAERDEALGPEFVGPWIPPNAAHNGHNGSNGRGHPERSENG
jgi:hypothetical protein